MRSWHILLIILSIGAIIGYLQPLRESHEKQERELKEIHSTIGTLREQIKEIMVLKKEKSDLSSEFIKNIPLHPEQDALIQDIYTLTLQNGFTFESLSFTKGENPEIGISEIKTTFTTEGSKKSLIAFLRAIETNQRFMGLESLSVRTHETDGQSTVRFGVSLYAFYQQSE